MDLHRFSVTLTRADIIRSPSNKRGGGRNDFVAAIADHGEGNTEVNDLGYNKLQAWEREITPDAAMRLPACTHPDPSTGINAHPRSCRQALYRERRQAL